VRFVGFREGVIAAAATFVHRCRRASITINDLPAGPGEAAALAEMARQEGDWLGAAYDYTRSRQRLAKKTVHKLKASWGRRSGTTNRRYAAHIGLLFFAASVLYSPLGSYFDAFKQLRLRSQRLTEDPTLWWCCGVISGCISKPAFMWTRSLSTHRGQEEKSLTKSSHNFIICFFLPFFLRFCFP
jgi:hypothetical protein